MERVTELILRIFRTIGNVDVENAINNIDDRVQECIRQNGRHFENFMNHRNRNENYINLERERFMQEYDAEIPLFN